MQLLSVNVRVFDEYLASKSNIGLAEKDILALMYVYQFFKLSVPWFPNFCGSQYRNLPQPRTAPSLAKLLGYQRLPRGGVCRRAYVSALPSGAAGLRYPFVV
jgi:hypothetical protein